jgi:hypothetical protein
VSDKQHDVAGLDTSTCNGHACRMQPDARTLERQAAGAEQLMSAKITEFGAHLMAGNRQAAERARTEAMAALEAHFDLTDRLIETTYGRGA